MNKIAFFPGSFDPFHEGHEFVVNEGLKNFDFIYIIISWNPNKKRKQSFDDTFKYLSKKYKNNTNIGILVNDEHLTSEVADFLNCYNIIRGYRNFADLSYENKLRNEMLKQNSNLKFFYYTSNGGNLVNIRSSILRDKR